MINIVLTRGQSAIVSDEDADLTSLKWCASWNGYNAFRATRRDPALQKNVFMHRVVAERMGILQPGLVVDHINGNALDNRRENLRCVTHRENSRNIAGARAHNTSGELGVRYEPSKGSWKAHINVGDRTVWLGSFDTKAEAIAARKGAERVAWGIQPRRASAHA